MSPTEQPTMSEYRRREQSITLAPVEEQLGVLGDTGTDDSTHELLTLNFGPHHPATHGVLRLLVTLQGEIVRDVKPIIGYVHTGIEKTAEDKSYWKVIPVIERMDYLSYYFNAMAFCGAVETLLEVEVPKRAQYLRVIHLELNRIMSHLVWLGTSALDLGAISMFWYCFREREKILDLFEMSSGQRMHTRYFQVGGVIEDIPRGFAEKLQRLPGGNALARGPVRDMLNGNEIVLQRLRGTCPLDAEHAAVARRHRPAAARRRQPVGPAQGRPLLLLRRLRVQDPRRHRRRQLRPLRRAAWPRCTSRSRSSAQALDGLPEGPHITEDRKVALPPRHELATSMEALIHHFKLVTEGMRVPPGEVYFPIESPRGELGCFVRSDGSSKPARVHMRDPSFVNLQATAPMVKGAYIADLIATLAMLDPILGGIDR